MHLLILGLVLVIGILVYYIVSTGSGNSESDDKKAHKQKKKKASDDLRKEGNVVYLPRESGDADTGTGKADVTNAGKPDGSSDGNDK